MPLHLRFHRRAQPGDAVLLNAANSTVGQLVIQLCHLLRLRAIAVISSEPDFAKTSLALKALGAAEVLLDSGSLKASARSLRGLVGAATRAARKHAASPMPWAVQIKPSCKLTPISSPLPSLALPLQLELDKAKFYSKPRLALDAVGGASAMRLSDARAEGGQLVVYGAMSGKSAQFSWHQWVFQGIQVGGEWDGGGSSKGGGGASPGLARPARRISSQQGSPARVSLTLSASGLAHPLTESPAHPLRF